MIPSPGLETIRRLRESALVINSKGDTEYIFTGGESIILDNGLRAAALVHLARAVNKVVNAEIEESIVAGVRSATGILAETQDRLRVILRV